MPALVRGHGDGVCIFLYGAIDHFGHAPVVPQVNHLHPCCLDDPSHDVDGGVVAVKKGGGGHHPDLVGRLIRF